MNPEDADNRSRTLHLARLGELLAGFAHEVRNPLSTIGLNLQLIREDFAAADSPQDRRTHKRLSVVEAEVKRLQQMVEEFLRFARMPDVQPVATDLNAVLQGVIDISEAELRERGVSLRFFPDAGLGLVPLDPAQVRAAVVNLVRNAAQACAAGDEVILSSRRDGSRVLVQVIDTGAGMSADVRARIFEPYFSTKETGTGLGLPMVRRVLEAHGGRVEVSSEVGKGTQFTLVFPAAARAADDPAAGAGDG
jgi:signal transduction histidine kinase